ncbi:MAG TPA: ABC transporter permease, partial [Thermoanaerobaculia bacterium]
MSTLGKDFRFGIRTLARTPAFSLIAIATLALAIGATSSLFSVFNGVLLRPLPYRNSERLVQVWSTDPQQINNRHSPGDYLDLKRQARSFEILAGYEERSFEVAGQGEPRRIRGAEVTPDFFEVFGVPPSIGRTLNTREDGAGSPRRAVVSDALWKRAFGSSPSILGQPLRVNGEDVVVVGVLPASFDWPTGIEMWSTSRGPVPASPMALEGDPLQNRELQYFDAVARLGPQTSISAAQSELAAIAQDLQRRFPQTNRGRAWRLVTLHQQLVGDIRPALNVLLAAILCVWLVACANIATLMLARASRRQREMAIRTALGASRGHLLRQLVAEGLLLAAAGGSAGLGFAFWGTKLLVRLAPPEIPRLSEITLDGRATLVAVALSLAAGQLFGLTPSFPSFARGLSPILTF